MKIWRLVLLVLSILVVAGAVPAFAKNLDLKILSGRWICPECDREDAKGDQAECEAQGHTHALKLHDGTVVNFVPSNRAEALIHGGGRHSLPIKICGFYDPKELTLDVESYAIEGKWTLWCDAHQRMDMCRGNEREASTEKTETSAR